MIWTFINSGFCTGYFNMNYDIELADTCNIDQAALRLYRWKPYCISLGAHQDIKDIDTEKAEINNIEIVNRPTGGRAILHAEELTYSIVIYLTSGLTPKTVYNKVSLAIVNGLSRYHPTLKKVELRSTQPDFKSLLKQPEGKICFASTAKSEITFEERKLVGSAQRKYGNVILQHGSILCGPFHKNLIHYLPEKEQHISDLETNTCDIEEITLEKVNYDHLADCLKQGFETVWGIKFGNKVNYPSPQFNS